MTRRSDDINDLDGDIARFKTLLGVMADKALEIDCRDAPEATRTEINEVQDLIWILRDLMDQIAWNADACLSRVTNERAEKVRRSKGPIIIDGSRIARFVAAYEFTHDNKGRPLTHAERLLIEDAIERFLVQQAEEAAA